MNIDVYIDSVEKKLGLHPFFEVIERFDVKKLPPPQNRAKITVTVHCFCDVVFDMTETVETGLCYPQIINYKYQYRKDDYLVRYDAVPHFLDLPNCPHHKHIEVIDDKKVEPSTNPSLSDIITEINSFISNLILNSCE